MSSQQGSNRRKGAFALLVEAGPGSETPSGHNRQPSIQGKEVRHGAA